MKQILQSLSTGETEVAEVPCPRVRPGHVLVRTRASLVSAGTERMLVEFGRGNWLERARQQPDKVRMVLDKARTDGVMPTLEAVRSKLDRPMPMGYANVGVVIEAGEGVTGLAAGDRVASNGPHAEVVCVPANLCARVPEAVDDEAAAFTVVGAVALQGVRLAAPTLGEAFVVSGLGLIGLLAVQLLRAHGCRVLGVDFDPARLALARACGAETADLGQGEDIAAAAAAFSRGRGVDGVLICAATQSSEPVRQAAHICRKRGRIVLVGVTGLDLVRDDFYKKELVFQVSCSYGPGRHDPAYESGSQDYPVGFVRWTAQRNFEAVLDMLAAGRLETARLVSHRFPLEGAAAAYDLIASGEPSLGVLLQYPGERERPTPVLREQTVRLRPLAGPAQSRLALGVIGAGNHAQRVLIPALLAAGAQPRLVASNDGVSGAHAARKFGFHASTTDVAGLLADPDVTAVVVATRHDSHARLVCDALRAGKHVFVEKPLAIRATDLAEIEALYAELGAAGGAPLLMVGFNRRFAPQVARMRELLTTTAEPKAFIVTVNAGAVPPDDWTRDPAAGGGRIAGEACHFVDLLRHLAGHPIVAARALPLGGPGGAPRDDVASLSLAFADGSTGAIHYLANGHRSFPKERVEVFCGGRVLQLDNFRRLSGYGWPGFRKLHLWRQDKGHAACAAAFAAAVRAGGPAPIPFAELVEVSRVTLTLAAAARGSAT